MSDESPYQGLAPYEDSEEDVALFFGRDRECDVIVANLMAARLTILYGESGAGKTSLLRAGVAHRLRTIARGNIEKRGAAELAVVVFDRWRDEPSSALREAIAEAAASALGDGAIPLAETATLGDDLLEWSKQLEGEVYVILDQLEEYFVYHGDESAPGSLSAELASALEQPNLNATFLLSIREDALATLDAFKPRIPNILQNYLRLEALDRAAGQAAIVEPLRAWNRAHPDAPPMEIEPALVEAVLDQVVTGKVELGQARGAVARESGDTRVETPYLQLVMQRVWFEERGAGSDTLRLETLERLGGAERIVRDHLARALTTLTAEQQDIAAAVFEHLVTPSGTKIAHEPRDLAGWADLDVKPVAAVLDKLSSERILRTVAAPSGGSSFEIYHDVLAAGVLEWKAEHDATRALERERAEASRRHRRLVAILLGGTLIVIALAVLSAVAVSQWHNARDQTHNAQQQTRNAQAQALIADSRAQMTTDPAASLRDALHATQLEPTPQAQSALRDALRADHLLHTLPAGSGEVYSARYSHDGRRVVTADADGSTREFDAATGRPVRVLRQAGPVVAAEFSPDDSLIAAGGKTGASLWNARTGHRRSRLGPGAAVVSVSFAPTGDRVVTGVREGRAVIWNTRTGARVRAIPVGAPLNDAEFSPDGRRVLALTMQAQVFDATSGRLAYRVPDKDVLAAAFSPHGDLLATAGTDYLHIWDAGTGKPVAAVNLKIGHVFSVDFDSSGTYVVTGSADGFARVWKSRDGRLVTNMSGHSGYVKSGEFSPDGRYVVTASNDHTARVWRATGSFQALLAGASGPVTSALFSPGGRNVVTAGSDGAARLWDATTTPDLRTVASFAGELRGAESAPGGKLVAIAGPGRHATVMAADGSGVRHTVVERGPVTAVALGGDLLATASGNHVTLWNVAGGSTRVRAVGAGGPVTSVAISPDGSNLAVGLADGRIRLSDARDRTVRTLRGPAAAVNGLAFSPSGDRLVSALANHDAWIWTVPAGRHVRTLHGHTDEVTSARFSPDGRLVVTASVDHTPRIWDARTGRTLRKLEGHSGAVSDAGFSPDGRWVVTAGPITAGLWHVAGSEPPILLSGPAGDELLTGTWFTAGSDHIGAVGQDGRLRVYHCEICAELPQLQALAATRLAARSHP